jgi:hypothetical protein
LIESVPLRHAVRSAACALAFGAVVAGLARGFSWPIPVAALVGWALATTLGAGCGARLVALHGTRGAGFLVAHGTCTLARLFAFAGGVGWALSRSSDDALAFIAGLLAGYLPTQVFELVWFARRTKA